LRASDLPGGLVFLRCSECDWPLSVVSRDLAAVWRTRCPPYVGVPGFTSDRDLTDCQRRSFIFSVRKQEERDWRKDRAVQHANGVKREAVDV
jgi:hypothetical protein